MAGYLGGWSDVGIVVLARIDEANSFVDLRVGRSFVTVVHTHVRGEVNDEHFECVRFRYGTVGHESDRSSLFGITGERNSDTSREDNEDDNDCRR
ncbi:hypothetical protein ACFPYI_14120 [Halomarina salina]|uniref:Uncharacterized protein n=1 Tax=Halomarina salina TaxID=1872699 RepID=A0ABD5RP86_9EURY|nr:hypothetical protein [Halomarina salina]